MSNMSKDYVRRCNEQVVSPMLARGLDTECYYRYLCETNQVVPCGNDLMGKLKAVLLDEYSDAAEGTMWQIHFAQTFKHQREFIEALLVFIDGNLNDDVRDVVQLQYDFILMTLHMQKRFFDTITFWVPYRALAGTQGGSEYADAQEAHEKLLKKVKEAIRENNF